MLKKQLLLSISLILILAISAMMASMPAADAHTPAWTIPTYCYIAVQNNPIGVNQEVLIIFWVNSLPPTAIGAYGDRWTFNVEVTKPDGSKETLGPYTSDPIGGGWSSYTPTQTGTYTLVAKFVEHKITGIPVPPMGYSPFGGGGAFINDTYSASSSEAITLIVQEEEIQPWQEAPLPTQYWTRPINSLNRNWACLAGNWLAGAAQNVGPTTSFGYGTGPESAHIMWTRPMWAGGIMDTRFGDIGYYNYHYEGLHLLPPIILNGKLYYNVPSNPQYGWYCVDLYTGETEYFHNTTGPVTGAGGGFDYSGSIQGEKLAFGQIYDYEAPNQHGGYPYLWSTGPVAAGFGGPPIPPGVSTDWMMFDAFTGNYVCSLANVSGGTAVYGKDGSILRYSLSGSGANKRLLVWNTSRAIWYEPSFLTNEYWMWRPSLNKTFDGNNGYSLNASIPNIQGSILAVREDQYVIGGTSGKNNGTYVLQGNLWALNLKADSNGVITPTLLWNITFTPPQAAPDIATTGGFFAASSISGPTVDPEDGVFLFSEALTQRRWGYSLETGQQLWGPTPAEPQLNYYGMQNNIYQGMLLSAGYGGVLIAYDIKTGKQLWNYTAANVGRESPYGNYPMGIGAIADGKVYIGAGEHSITQPPWRGPVLRCINASNGAELWKFPLLGVSMASGNAGDNFAIADGYLLALNGYDNQIYCFGKGPSATTVTASPKVSVDGSSVMIEGMVTDQCAGAKELADRLGYANGVPAISDEDQQAWMEYLYAQQARPANAEGVEVTLDTLDPNGNFVHIGTATSDMSGMFKKMYTPEVPGEYTIIATFAGSESYWPSYAETAIGIEEAPPASPTPEYPQPIDPTWTIVGVGIAMLIAIAIAAIWIKKK